MGNDLYTEEEAGGRRCCVPTCGIPDPTYSQAKIASLRGNVPHYCIGSHCMGWRWSEMLFDGKDSYQSKPGPKGYCGRAGLHVGLE